jgi:hypothetical protein
VAVAEKTYVNYLKKKVASRLVGEDEFTEVTSNKRGEVEFSSDEDDFRIPVCLSIRIADSGAKAIVQKMLQGPLTSSAVKTLPSAAQEDISMVRQLLQQKNKSKHLGGW